MAERLLTVPRQTKAGVTETLTPILVKDCALSDLDELWIDLPLVGTRIIVDHPSLGAVREYRLFYGTAATVPANAVAISGHTGYYWVPAGSSTRNVIVVTSAAARTLTSGESGSRIITTGNAGTAVVNLPAAVQGLTFEFQISTAFALQIEPATGETIGLPSTGVQEAANDYITADAVNEYVTLVCDVAGTWTPSNYLGTWTGQ
jgi:hypothetical protein